MILRNYLIRETLSAFAFILLVILVVYLTSAGVEYLGDAASGELTADAIFWLLALKLLAKLKIFAPVCLFLGILLSVGRMRRQQELTAYSMLGLGTAFFFRTTVLTSLGVAGVVAAIAFVFEPWADRKVYTLEQQAKEEAEVFGIAPGQFRELSGGNKVIFAEDVSSDSREFEDVFLRVRINENEGVLSAQDAYVEDNAELKGRFVIFHSGRRYDGHPGQADYAVVEFEKYGVLLERTGEVIEDPRLLNNVSMMPTFKLLKQSDALAFTELHWRFAMPLATVVLALLGISLARMRTLGGPYATMLTGVLIYLVYSNLLGIAKSFAKKGDISAEIGLLPVHLGMLLVIVAIEWYSVRGGWRRA